MGKSRKLAALEQQRSKKKEKSKKMRRNNHRKESFSIYIYKVLKDGSFISALYYGSQKPQQKPIQASAPKSGYLFQSNVDHEFIRKRLLPSHRQRGLPTRCLQQKEHHLFPRNPNRRSSSSPRRDRQARRFRRHQGSFQVQHDSSAGLNRWNWGTFLDQGEENIKSKMDEIFNLSKRNFIHFCFFSYVKGRSLV